MHALATSFRNVFLTIAATALIAAGCSKKEEAESSSGGSPAAVSSAPTATAEQVASTLSNTILRFAPQDTFSFYLFDTTSTAYSKYKASQWSNLDQLMKQSKDSLPPEISSVLEKAGIDIADAKTWSAMGSQVAVFAAPEAAGQQGVMFGLVFQSQKDFDLSKKMAAIKTALASHSPTDLKLKQGTGFSITPPPPTSGENAGKVPPFKFCFGNYNNLGVIASSQSAVDSVLSSEGKTLPAVLSTADFKNASKGLPPADSTYALAYVDFNATVKALQTAFPADVPPDASKLPLRVGVLASAMNEVPQNVARLLYQPTDDLQKELFGTLNVSASGMVLSAVPSNPLLFLSVDGTTIKKIKEVMLKDAGGTPNPGMAELKQTLAGLDSLKRVGLAAKIAPVGQSMFSMIPDIIVLLETDKPDQVRENVVALVDEMSKGPGGAGGPMGGPMGWADKDIAGTKAKVMAGPMPGLGIHIASTKGMVIAASTEGQLKSSLEAIGGKGDTFTSKIPERTKAALSAEPSLTNLYLDFNQIGNLIQQMGGMLQAFAPPDASGAAQKFLEPEKIDSIKRMGIIVGSVRSEPGVLEIRSSYEPGAVTAATPKQVALANH